MNVVRPRRLSDAELSTLLSASAAVGGSVYLFMLLMILTGQRAREIEMAAWSDFDFGMGLWLRSSSLGFSGRSYHRPYPLPLSELAHRVLTEAAPSISERNGRIICRAGSELPFRAHLHRAIGREKANSDMSGGWSVHNLRRTFAERMVIFGARPEILSSIMLMRYSGVAERIVPLSSKSFIIEGRPLLEQWSRYVRDLLDRKLASANASSRPAS